MSAVTGTFRGGKIELHGPPPVDWVDGTEVSVSPREPASEIDLTGDSPEAIAAWIEAMAEVHKLAAGSSFVEELEAVLAEDKRQELSRWEEEAKRAEGVFK